jgi:hypothetical protein
MALSLTPQGHAVFLPPLQEPHMPNITITVDDRLYCAARIHAVNRKTTLTEIVREFLLHTVLDSGEYNFAEISEDLVRFEQRRHPGIFRAKGYQAPTTSFHCDREQAG